MQKSSYSYYCHPRYEMQGELYKPPIALAIVFFWKNQPISLFSLSMCIMKDIML